MGTGLDSGRQNSLLWFYPGKKPNRVMFALFIMGLMASMASAEPDADAQFFYYPSYQPYPTYPNYQYTAPSYYYPSYVYPSVPKVQVHKKVEPVKEPVVDFNLDVNYTEEEPVVETKKDLKLRPIVPFFGLRSGQVQFLRPDEVKPTPEQDEKNVLAYSSVPYTQA